MTKKEIVKTFNKLHNIAEKEKFMKANDIHFTYNSFYNLIVWAEDGILELKPHEWKGIYYGKV